MRQTFRIAVLCWVLCTPSQISGAAPAPTPTPATPDVIELVADGSINWSHHHWRVRGHSLPVSPALSFGGPIRQAGGALSLARADALSRLERLSAAMFWGPVLPPFVFAPIQTAAAQNAATSRWGEAHDVATQFFADGHVVLTQEFSWDQALAEAMWQARQAALQTDAFAPSPAEPITVDQPELTAVPTGLIVNAHGLKVRPALLPQIRDDFGAVLFDVRDVHPEALSRFGVARYSHSLDAAVRSARMGKNPVVVRAHATNNLSPPHILFVDARQAAVVHAARAALAQSRLIVVVDDIKPAN